MDERGIPPIGELLASRRGEELELNDRFLNPQMGRILRTLGFDRVWAGGEGAHLIDDEGERYLDLIGGYGVFAIGRNHPEVIAAIGQVMAASTANLPQLGVTLLTGVLAEQLLARAPGERRRDDPGQHRHRGGGGGDQDRPRGDRPQPRSCTPTHAFHGLTLGSLSLNGNEEFRERLRAAAAGMRAGGVRRPRGARARRSRAATSPPSWSSRSRARASTSRRTDT